MAQQSANYLFKAAKRAHKGKGFLDAPLWYLEHFLELATRKCSAKAAEDFLNLDLVDEALTVNISRRML